MFSSINTLKFKTKGIMENSLKRIDSMDDFDKKKLRRKILKNIIIISFCFLLNFTAFQGLSRLQVEIFFNYYLHIHRSIKKGEINFY